MRAPPPSKSGQIALLLVFLLTGLVLLFLLNVDLFRAARSKLRLQNIADASAMTMATWQGMSLNLVGDLNFAHIKAINDIVPANENTTNFIAGITALQRHLKSLVPLIGFDAANQLAQRNGASASEGMKEVNEIIAKSTDPIYAELIRRISRNGVYAGIDNTKSPTGILHNPRFYKAIQREDFQELCQLGGYRHALPPAGATAPSAESMFHRGCIGYIGTQEYSFENQPFNVNIIIDSLVDLSHAANYRNANISSDNLKTNEAIILSADYALSWSVFDTSDEWRQIPNSLQPGNFPWIDSHNISPMCSTMGGSSTIRVEDAYITTNSILTSASNEDALYDNRINPITEFNNDNIVHKEIRHTIVAQSAAKIVARWPNGAVTRQSLNPPLIIPAFSCARYVPFALGANGRDAMADIEHVSGFPKSNGDSSAYQAILDKYHSTEFRAKAAKWFANHEHSVVCDPPTGPGGSMGGGTPRVP